MFWDLLQTIITDDIKFSQIGFDDGNFFFWLHIDYLELKKPNLSYSPFRNAMLRSSDNVIDIPF